MGGTSKVLLGIVVAGMMAIDMGGSFQQSSICILVQHLLVHQWLLETKNGFLIMAAVMAGGMVPAHLQLALCTTFFGNRFTEKWKKIRYKLII